MKTGLVLIFYLKKIYTKLSFNQCKSKVKYEIFQLSLKECQISDQKLSISKTIFPILNISKLEKSRKGIVDSIKTTFFYTNNWITHENENIELIDLGQVG